MPKINKNSATALDYDAAHKNMQVEDCAENLIIANNACALQSAEKEKRTAELHSANKELASLNEEKDRYEAELAIANKKLSVEKKKRRKQTQELTSIHEDIKDAKASEKASIEGLREMMFMTSHQLRKPVVQILGLANILDTSTSTPEEVNEIVEHMKESAETLDHMTKELTTFIHHQEVKATFKAKKK